MTCVPCDTKTHTLPPSPILAITPLGTVELVTKFRLDAVGRVVPHGHTVAKPAPADSVTVTLSTAVDALAGTSARPATGISITEAGLWKPAPAPAPSTV